MALLDLLKMDARNEVEADLCLVGAGAAGITIAQALADTGVSICLLESGGEGDEPETQALYEGATSNHPMDLDEGRYRVLGGSTSRWTGRCARLDPIDFAERSWVPYSGWPIDLASLAPFYREAERICGFAEPWVADEEAQRQLGLEPVLNPDVESFLWRYSPIGKRQYRNWGHEYRDVLRSSESIRTILHANVVEWVGNEGGQHVDAIIAKAFNGNTVRVCARSFVLCAGGLENARLLLSSRDDIPGGVGAAQDMVGRFFMQHPRGIIGELEAEPKTALALQDRHTIFEVESGLQYETGFALSEAAQRDRELLNASVILLYEADPTSGWEALKRLGTRDMSQGGLAKDAMRVLKDPVSASRNLWRRAVAGKHAAYPTATIQLQIDLEQRPDPASRVTLSDDRDRLGMRKPVVHWTLAEQERTTSAAFCSILGDFFSKRGIGSVRPAEWLSDTGPIGSDALLGTFHHIATTRMSADASTGVVDRNCRVHGTDNLYVAGCATFSTGGHANPTFTIVALALRLADHLRQQLGSTQIAAQAGALA